MPTHKIRIGRSFTDDTERHYVFRYAFIPESANLEQTQQLAVEDNSWILKLQNTADPDMPHLLKSANTPGKDLECILIFDPATQEYVLERQYSSFNFQRIRKIKSGKRSRSQDSVRSAPTEKEESSWSQDDDFDLDQAVAEAIDTPMGSPEVESHVESQVESHMETPKSPQSQPIEAGPRSLFNESDDGSSSVEG